MSEQMITRSNSLKEQIPNSGKTAKGRKFSALSPELENNSSKKQKAKSRDMDEALIDIRNQLSQLSLINSRVEKLPILEKKIDCISSEISQFKKDVDRIKSNMTKLDEKQNDLSKRIDDCQIAVNIADQVKLEDQIMITNISKQVTKESLIKDIDKWSGGLLNTLGHKRVVLSSKKKLSTAFIHFWSNKDKARFLDFIKNQEKKQDAYHPILNEIVFDLNEDDTAKPTILHFQTPMTQINQKIFKEARNYKKNKKIENCWMSNGSIYIKKVRQTKGTRIDSLQQLKDAVNFAYTETELMDEATATSLES
jgi:hypothetical protein